MAIGNIVSAAAYRGGGGVYFPQSICGKEAATKRVEVSIDLRGEMASGVSEDRTIEAKMVITW